VAEQVAQTEVMEAAGLRGRLAAQLRRWDGLGGLAFIVIAASLWIATPLAAALVLLWAWLSHTPFKAIGLVRPGSWTQGLAAGVALGLFEKFLLKAVILPLLGAPAVNEAYHFLAGNPKRAIVFAVLAVFQAGICEEILFRGYLFERLGRLLGKSLLALIATVVITSALFGGLHYEQGFAGVANAAIGGFMSGTIYLLNRRRLYTVMVSHAVFDLAALVMIYWNFENVVAHLIFK
jgi:membrane protease YdiL (CAAX protease family)